MTHRAQLEYEAAAIEEAAAIHDYARSEDRLIRARRRKEEAARELFGARFGDMLDVIRTGTIRLAP